MDSNPEIFRHGDLLFRQIDKLPGGTKQLRTNVVAEGEVSNHKHRLMGGQALIYADRKGNKFVKAEQQSQIVHEEHKPLVVPPGTYEVVQEQEFDPFEREMQRVRD